MKLSIVKNEIAIKITNDSNYAGYIYISKYPRYMML
jgi:hypothetical protein